MKVVFSYVLIVWVIDINMTAGLTNVVVIGGSYVGLVSLFLETGDEFN